MSLLNMLLLSFCYAGAIFGYYSYSSVNNQLYQINGDQLTHLVYAFAYLNSDGTITPGFSQYDADVAVNMKLNCNCGSTCLNGIYGELFQFKKKYSHVKTLISIGGWTWSTYFSKVFSSSATRTKMVESVTDFITKYGFDGIDVDFEFPEVTWREPGFTHSPNDYKNMLAFSKELKAYWKQKSINGILTLAMQAQGSPKFNALSSQYDKYVDYYLVMTYEYQHQSGLARHHSNLNVLQSDPSDFSPYIKSGMEKYVFNTPSKVIVGIPAYSNDFKVTQRRDLNNIKGLGSKATALSSHMIYKHIRENNLNVEWDQKRGACSYFNEKESTFHGFDCVHSVQQKAQYVKQKKYGGLFLWELGQDSLKKFSLLEEMSKGVSYIKSPRAVCQQKSGYCNLKC
eukprot:NODE_811_length_4002_cov_0.418909.p2 type:complete len:398 gc:universal NODE_811_length_4002_cov_0.418909:3611-2418(-)